MTNKKTFLGAEISKYGIQNNRVDYATLASTFQCIFCNDTIMKAVDDWELINGEEDPSEIFSYYLIDECGSKILSEYTNEMVYYSSDLDVYVWGITHYGDSWDSTLTSISIDEL